MGDLKVYLDDKLEKKFRIKLAEEGKSKKGGISSTICRLIEKYINEESQ